ncbi:hypothetical protein F4779DRAFT_479592 [Xylariaceae sp. FL0662B]|nr:hypothetical protein F4779DRAFT_479592 [Xylariaceae sp. FL0662B]
MTMFSLIKQGRAQAKEHNAKQAEKVKDKAVDVPYKHVVTHAAIDALSGSPSSWKHDDRPKIMEQNKKRTAMRSNGPNMGGMPRVGSSLSYVSYPSPHATPVVPLPKNHSYSSIPASWREKTVNYSEGIDYFSHPGSIKGKERESIPLPAAVPKLPSEQASELPSKGVYIDESSRSSSSSSDELSTGSKAMSPHTHYIDHRPRPSQPGPSNSENVHRLHPASQRKKAEMLNQTSDRHYPPPAKSTYFAAPRPSNRRAFSLDTSIPPVPALPALAVQFDSGVSSSSTSGLVSSASSAASLGIAASSAPSSIASTPTTSTTDIYNSSKQNHTQVPVASVAPTQTLSTEKQRASVDITVTNSEGQVPSATARPPHRRRLSKTRRPMDVEMPSSNIDNATKMSIETVRPVKPSAPAALSAARNLDQTDQPTQQPLLEAADQATDSMRKTSRKLTKNPEAQLSKSRPWSFRSSSKTRVTTA